MKSGILSLLLASFLVGSFALPTPSYAASDLEAAMEALNDNFKIIRKKSASSTLDEELVLAARGAQEALLVALSLEPNLDHLGLPPAEKAKLFVLFRETIAKTLVEAYHLERATLSGDAADVKVAVDALVELRAQGHDVFRKK
ncbi:MAG: hypothetical protein KDD25_01540 [Bdellovibrionales bacterium]|nr:hypothetical protein [Bdellovibrionales bacterium]